MSGDRWELLSSALESALARPPRERGRALRRTCGDDAELLAEAEALLATQDGTGPFDRLFTAFAGSRPCDGEGLDREGQRLGPYRIDRLIGRGGMGTVYLAHRADGQFEQRVAVKMLRTDASAPGSRRRFLAERQILARLSHPHIARVFDGGVTPDGTPYLVMEYVQGTPIDRFCDARRLTVTERLSLVALVCETVQFAHQNLVVHRDLKPGNILVSESGHPKLLDFGVARVLTAGSGVETLTRTGWLPLTPAYASPEQVRGEPVTTAADVYALGAILYELLSGRRPYGFERMVPTEIERVVCAARPPPPSTVVGKEGQRDAIGGGSGRPPSDAVCRARSSTAKRLRRALRGDVDTLVLKALRKDPARRYPSAGEMAADIRRHLAGRPVQARPATRLYRLSKFLGRHRTGGAMAVVLLAAVVAFTAMTAVQARRIARERDHATRVTELLGDVFASADPTVVPGAELTVREALDRGVEHLHGTLETTPEVEARLMGVIAEAYHNLGALDRSIAVQEKALATLRSAVPPRHPLFLEFLRNLGSWKAEAGKAREGEALLRRALDIARRLGPRRAPELAATLNAYGLALQTAGDHGAAEPLFVEALEIYRRLAEPPPAMEYPLANLGWIAHGRGDWAAAEARFREVLERRRGRLRGENPLLAVSLMALSDVLLRRERLEEAEALAAEALDIARANYSSPHPNLARALAANADIAGRQGRFTEAEGLQRAALAMFRQLFGDDHATVAYATNDLADRLRQQGRLGEAAALFREAVERFAGPLGERHPFTAVVRTNLAWTEHLRGRSAKAEAIYRRAVPVLDSAWSGTSTIAKTLVDFGVVLSEMRKDAEAVPLLRRALQLERATWPPGHERILRAEQALGACLAGLRRFEEAEGLLLDAWRNLVETRGAADVTAAAAAGELVKLYEAWGKEELAVKYRGMVTNRQ